MEDTQRARAKAAGSSLDVFAAAEGMEFEIIGKGAEKAIIDVSALDRRPIAGGRVMVVTPHQGDISAIEQVLPDDGLIITAVSDGRTALEVSRTLPPALVILDAKLADGDGASFIQPLRSLLGSPDLPTIILTAERDGTETLYSAESIATDYLAKPFSPPMLRTRIRAWLARTIGTSPVPPDSVLVIPASERSAHDIQSSEQQRPVEASYANLLASVSPFSELRPEDRARLVAHATEHTYPPGHIVVRQDDLGGPAYVIISGRVRVVESVPESPVEMSLGELGPGEIFGELGVLREPPRPASVMTLERTRCLAIPSIDFLKILQESKAMSLALLRILAGRLYEADRLLARHAPDPLTGLPGRRAFKKLYQRLTAEAQRRGSGVVLLLLDVLHLKEINDRFGYSVGDDVLRTVADALVESSRGTDLVARHGSDEFTVLLIEADAKDVDIIIKRVQQKLIQLAVYRNLPLTVACRIGCVVSQHPPESPDELLRLADEQMQGKRSGQAK
jgi:diguanylate cyclase (GGDEF)-like protein